MDLGWDWVLKELQRRRSYHKSLSSQSLFTCFSGKIMPTSASTSVISHSQQD